MVNVHGGEYHTHDRVAECGGVRACISSEPPTHAKDNDAAKP